MFRHPGKAIVLAALSLAVVLPLTEGSLFAQGRGRGRPNPPTPTLGLEDGTLDFDTPDFTLKLVKDSQTIAAMEPKGAKGLGDTPFDFTPADQLPARQANHFNHLGDITLRLREGNGEWKDYASSDDRKPVSKTDAGADGKFGKVLSASDMTPTLAADCPLQVTRSWLVDSTGRLVLHFDIKNKSNGPVTIGGLGFPVVFNNMIQNFVTNRARTLPQAHEICSFADPYVGQDSGYLQVTRLSGAGPALLVVPENDTKTPFEAYRPLDDASPKGQTFEGAFDWTVRSEGYEEKEWKGVKQWNPPTEETLQPGQTISHGIRFLVSDTIRDIEKTLAENKRPVAVGIPGYILPMEMDGKLFLNTEGRKVAKWESDPEGGLTLDTGPATKSGWLNYTVHGKTWGRARLTLTYDDGTTQGIQYYVIKPEAQAVADLGNFLFTKQWYTDTSDPFHRAPSIMTYDRGHDRIVTQDQRVWIAGLEDEGGAGSWIAATMKEFGQPKKEEVEKLEEFVDKTLWGGIQYSEGPRMWGVRKSLFYYDPKALPDFKYDPSIQWERKDPQTGEMVPSSWTEWNKQQSEAVDRAYNYPHVVAAYWTLYELARFHPGLVTAHPAQWYLEHAFNTVKYLTGGFNTTGRRGRGGVGYLNTGLMEGDVFVYMLDSLKDEGMKEEADYVETAMKRRADQWNQEPYPFGSEMAWDSTGQEEVYAWTAYFGYKDKALVSLDSILGYMPTLPHWGYNGNARRYWDFYYGAAPGGETERQIHHYGSGINAIPALSQYREHPDDYYLLRIGYGGAMGALSNIDQEGFAGTAFHTYPWHLKWDTYSGDYGPNFFGHAVNTATYIIDHPEFGDLAFGGNLRVSAGGVGNNAVVTVTPLDSFRKRIYVAPLGLYLTLDAGAFKEVRYVPAAKSLAFDLAPADEFTPNAYLHIEQPAKIEGVGTFAPSEQFKEEYGALKIPLGNGVTTIQLNAK